MQTSFCGTIRLAGTALYIDHRVTDAGRPTLVFLHDSLGCVRLWRDFPEELAQRTDCNVLLYDRQGYGQSAPMPDGPRPLDYLDREAGLLLDLLRHLCVQEAILFGHSDGGTIALLAAAQAPEQVRALVVEAAHIFVEAVTLAGIESALEAYRRTDLRERLKRYHGDKTDAVFHAWTDTWLRPDFRGWNIESRLPHIVSPLLFIQGTEDEYGSAAQVERTLALVGGPGAQFLVPATGHTPHRQSREACLAAAAAFISRL